MQKINKKPLAVFVGTTFVGMLSAGAVNAAENPFEIRELSSGYALVAEADTAKDKKEMVCGGEKRSAETMKPQKDKSTQQKPQQKSMEGKCGAGMMMDGAPESKSP